MTERNQLCEQCHGSGCQHCSWTGYTFAVQKENEIFSAGEFAIGVLLGKKCLYCDGAGEIVDPDNPNNRAPCPNGCKKPKETKRLGR